MVVAGLGREARGRDGYKLEPDSKTVNTATNFGVRHEPLSVHGSIFYS